MPATPSHSASQDGTALDLQSGLRPGVPYIFELECVRGLAILLVFLFHVYGISMGAEGKTPGPAMSFIVMGNTGVTLFFVLSGFLLSLPWLPALFDATATRPTIRSYYFARLLRVLPLYYAVVLFSVALTGNWSDGLKALGFLFVGFDIFPWSVVWWTLATEVQFYLLLPLVFSLLYAGRAGRLLVFMSLLAWLYFYVSLVLLHDPASGKLSYIYTKSIFGRLPAFLCGIAAACVYLNLSSKSSSWLSSPQARWLALAIVAAAALSLGVVLQGAAAMGDSAAEQQWHIHHTLEAALWAVMLLLLLLVRLPGKPLLVNRPMAITGKLSYSIYLNHVPILFYLIYPMRESIGQAAYATSIWLYVIPLGGLLASLGLGYLSFRLIEKPFLGMKHRLSR